MSELCSVRLLPRRNQLWMVATGFDGEVLLKGRLPLTPSHPRAAITVLEGLALWSGRPLPVALGVGQSSRSFIEALLPDGPAWMSPLVDIHLVDPAVRRSGRRLRGVSGDFRNVIQLPVHP